MKHKFDTGWAPEFFGVVVDKAKVIFCTLGAGKYD